MAPVNVQWPRLELSESSAPAYLTVSDTSEGNVTPHYNVSGASTSLYWSNGPGRSPTIDGSILHDDPTAGWTASGEYLFELGTPDNNHYRIRRYPAASVHRQEGQTLLPELDQQVAAASPAGFAMRRGATFEVDPVSGDLAITEAWSDVTTPRPTTSLLFWFRRSGSSYSSKLISQDEATIVVGIALFGGRAVLASLAHVRVLNSSGTTLARFTPDATIRRILKLLAADPRSVYVAVDYAGGGGGVLALRTSDLVEMARYDTEDSVGSLAFVGDKLVFGAESTLTVASPRCE